MPRLRDLTGQTFGKLTVLRRSDNSTGGRVRWLCQCECGNTTVVTRDKLTRRSTVSCGCWRNRRNGESKTRLYRIWYGMHDRCENPKYDHFDRYGGRGIIVCSEWADFDAFKTWALSNGYADDLSIDRIDGDGNYEPGNCRFATQREQMRNVSSNHIVKYQGRNYSCAEFAEFLNVKPHTVYQQLNKLGWSPEKIAERAGRHGKV